MTPPGERIHKKHTGNPLVEPKLPAEPMRAVGFNVQGRTLANRKETISKRDWVAQLISSNSPSSIRIFDWLLPNIRHLRSETISLQAFLMSLRIICDSE